MANKWNNQQDFTHKGENVNLTWCELFNIITLDIIKRAADFVLLD